MRAMLYVMLRSSPPTLALASATHTRRDPNRCWTSEKSPKVVLRPKGLNRSHAF